MDVIVVWPGRVVLFHWWPTEQALEHGQRRPHPNLRS
jgi:hypothetical protein